MDWFEKTFGFKENLDNIKDNIKIDGNKLFTNTSARKFIYGTLEIPSVKELRDRLPQEKGSINISQIMGNVATVHEQEPSAMFQVASQFNLLEMISPEITREQGITRYIYDRTQGPACAMACPYGTLYRNYFSDVNTLKDIEYMFNIKYWEMKNGYALFEKDNLIAFNKLIDANREEIIEKLRVGVQWDTEVAKTGDLVSQVYCSALPVSYHYDINTDVFEKFARVILEATYEAAFIASILNKKSNRLFLTLIGGGAFGNDKEWILDAIQKNINKFKNYDLDLIFINYSESNLYINNETLRIYSL